MAVLLCHVQSSTLHSERRHTSKSIPGPKKTPFLCPQGRVVHARGRVVLSLWTKVNTVISAVFVNFLGHFVSESVLYLQVATVAGWCRKLQAACS